MNIYFGKISNKYNINQIEEGFYEAPKTSTWFNGIQVGDLAYIIGGNKIQLWKAKKWVELEGDQDRLYFEVLIPDLNLEIKDLVAFKYFKLSTDLIVKTTRSTGVEKKAFFPIKLNGTIETKRLFDEDLYKNAENYRRIIVYSSHEKISESYDIQLYFKDDKLEINPPLNCEGEVVEKFKDNLKYLGQGQPRKDNTLAVISAQSNHNLSLSNKLSIKDIYDAFMCSYNTQNRNTRYWVLNGFDEDKLEYMLEENVFVMYFQYGVQKTSEVSQQLNKANQIKPGDKVLLFNKNRYYGHSTFTNVEIEYDKERTLRSQTKKREKNDDNQLIVYTDAPCYYEDLRKDNGFNGEWGQRLAVENWESVHNEGKSISGISSHLKSSITMNTIMELEGDEFYNMVKGTLNGQIKNIQEYKTMNELQDLLFFKKQIILQGPPGTGKTYLAKNLAEKVLFGSVSEDKELQKDKLEACKNFEIVQFHPSFTYEDFVRGISVNGSEDKITYKTEHKILSQICKDASESEEKFILVIDEINRANLPSVLGELIYALEYRGEAINTMYKIDNDSKIVIPENLLIIGTMNTADRSVGHIDYAIRRRFAFKEMLPKRLTELGDKFKIRQFEEVSKLFVKEIKSKNIELEASEHLSPEFAERPQDVWLGHSYFIEQKDEAGNLLDFKLRVDYEIIPILEEYIKDGILKNTEAVKSVLKELSN